MRVEILKEKLVLDGFFRVKEALLRHEKFNGQMTPPLRRLRFLRPPAAACLPYDPERREIVLVEQFRWPPYSVGDPGWLWEIPAGIVAEGEDPAECMKRELREEAGLEVAELEPVLTYFSTPGTTTEKIYLYFARVSTAGLEGRVGGAEEENEDIRVHVLSYEEAWRKVQEGVIRDGKTLLALLLLREREREGGKA